MVNTVTGRPAAGVPQDVTARVIFSLLVIAGLVQGGLYRTSVAPHFFEDARRSLPTAPGLRRAGAGRMLRNASHLLQPPAVAPMKRFSAFAGAVALAVLMVPSLARSTEELVRLVPTLPEAVERAVQRA